MRNFIITLCFFLVGLTSLSAQGRGGQRGGGAEAAIFQQLDLSEQQQADLQAIREDSRRRLQELRADGGQRPDRTALKAERERAQAAAYAVLTPTQQAEYDRLKAERKADRKEARENIDKEALRADLKRHHEEEVKPVLTAARGQLDKRISAEDQAAIERLRQTLKPEGDRQPRQARGDREGRQERRAAYRTDNAEELAELKALAAKYADDIDQLRERLAPQMATWEEERRAIYQQYVPQGETAGRRGGQRARQQGGQRTRRQGQPGKENHFGPRFLLLRP